MRFHETYNTVFIIGADEDLSKSIRKNLLEFFSFWKPSVKVVEFKDYFDFLLADVKGNGLVFTSEYGLVQLDNPNVFKFLKDKFDESRIVHCYQDFHPDKLAIEQKKHVESFVQIKGNYTLQINRLLRQINQF